ncbi:hypothetical protein [Clostridium magnum]|nr:hypothetical protein [Clostridium magnum]
MYNRLLGTKTIKSDLKIEHSDGIIDLSIKYKKNGKGIIINSV